MKIEPPMLHIHIKAMVFSFARKVRCFLREQIGVVGALDHDALTGELVQMRAILGTDRMPTL